MNEIDLEKYRSTWKNEQRFGSTELSESIIKKFLQSNSKNISRLFKAGLSIDIALKSLLAISFIGLIALFMNENFIVLINIFLLSLSLGGILYQMLTYRKIPRSPYTPQSIRESLETKINFYNQRYIKSLFIGALSNSLLFLSGTMYYFYFKYGEIRPFQLDDYVVFGCAIILSFVLGAFIQIKQHNFQIRQLESCLKEIDDDTIREHSLKKYKNQRTKIILIAIISLILGLLLLTYFIFK